MSPSGRVDDPTHAVRVGPSSATTEPRGGWTVRYIPCFDHGADVKPASRHGSSHGVEGDDYGRSNRVVGRVQANATVLDERLAKRNADARWPQGIVVRSSRDGGREVLVAVYPGVTRAAFRSPAPERLGDTPACAPLASTGI